LDIAPQRGRQDRMPEKKLLFLSHSTKDGTDAYADLQKLAASLTADFDVKFDKDEDALPKGENWRPIINSWIENCDAAVVLVTPASVASEFCAYEWSILSYRRRYQQRFLVIPLFLGMKASTIKGRPDQIGEIIGYDDVAKIESIIPHLMQRLKAEIAERNDDRVQVTMISDALCKAVKDDALIEAVARKHKIDLGSYDLRAGKQLRFARKIMALGGLAPSVGALRDLKHSFTDGVKAETFRAIVELVGRCSWVDAGSAQHLRLCALDKAARVPLGLNADSQRTAEAYILAASDTHPAESWCAGAVLDAYGAENDFLARVRSAVIEAIGIEEQDPDNAAIRNRLKLKSIINEPVFVLLRAAGLERAWIERLRTNELFAGVTFLILTGPDGTPGLLAEDAVLKPVLQPNFEQEVWSVYDYIVKHELKLDVA
jgi:TIR domain